MRGADAENVRRTDEMPASGAGGTRGSGTFKFYKPDGVTKSMKFAKFKNQKLGQRPFPCPPAVNGPVHS